MNLKQMTLLPDDQLAHLVRTAVEDHLCIVSANSDCDQTIATVGVLSDAVIVIGIINKEGS